jgi:lysine/ornithine N-monooxygenase
MRRDYLKGLPNDIVKQLYETKGISAEHSMKDQILHAVKQVESAIHFVQQHGQSHHTGQGSSTKSNADNNVNQSGYRPSRNNFPAKLANHVTFEKKGQALPR